MCETCDEYLCTLCYYAHLRVKLTRNHQFKIFSKIPQQKASKIMKNKETQVTCEVKRLKGKKLLVRPVTSRALETEKKCKQYTGVHLHFFNQLLKGLEGKFLSSFKMSAKDQLCMFYHKLKTNATNTILSINFGISVKRIKRLRFFDLFSKIGQKLGFFTVFLFINSLQELRTISFSVVNMTEKS